MLKYFERKKRILAENATLLRGIKRAIRFANEECLMPFDTPAEKCALVATLFGRGGREILDILVRDSDRY